MIRWTEMNSPALIGPHYISDFCGRINKFTCKSIMHDFIFIISTRESPRLPAFHHVPTHTQTHKEKEKDAGSLFWSGIHTVCFVPNCNSLFSHRQLSLKGFAVKISNEIVILKWNCRFLYMLGSRRDIKVFFFFLSFPFTENYCAIWTKSNLFTSRTLKSFFMFEIRLFHYRLTSALK